jgi:hypothetical protein
MLLWTKALSTEGLLLTRARQVARLHVQRLRKRDMELFDEKHQPSSSPLSEGKLVFVHDSRLDLSRLAKLQFRWFGQFAIDIYLKSWDGA